MSSEENFIGKKENGFLKVFLDKLNYIKDKIVFLQIKYPFLLQTHHFSHLLFYCFI